MFQSSKALVRALSSGHSAGAMVTVALFVLVSNMMQNCYLRSSQCSAEQDGEVNAWDEQVGNTSASVSSFLRLGPANARGRGLSAMIPLVKASAAVHAKGTRLSPHPGRSPGAFFSSSTRRRAPPAGEVSALMLPWEQEGEGSGTVAPARSTSLWPPGATKHPSGIWDKEIPARNRSKAYPLPSGNGTGIQLSTQRKKDNATQPPVTTARQKSPPASHWLPVLEKHDIPVAVGVAVSLALIFISMGVYSFRQKTESSKGNRTSSQKSPKSQRRRNYLEEDGVYENRAFEVECAVDAGQQNRPKTSTSMSLLHSDPLLPEDTAGHREEPPGVAAGEALHTAQARAGAREQLPTHSSFDSPASLQHESAHQETPPHPRKAAPSSMPSQWESARPREPSAEAPGTCSTTPLALQHVGPMLYFHRPELQLQSIVPLGQNTSGNPGQVTAAPVVGLVQHSPPRDQSSSGTAIVAVAVEIHSYPCSPELSSAPTATQNVSDSSCPEAVGAVSQDPASLVGPGYKARVLGAPREGHSEILGRRCHVAEAGGGLV
ncbi:uncharacterized protein LOC142024060 isoform X2 [Carettochelys insculpta]|uniref:uncharacterized protein LOC142024060 isoform X2 n=1 Tax=Carettochelys insculpta TaxID=44489 RepID=UPI003EBA18E0